MGQKVSPRGFRVGVIQDWDSKWYANKTNFAEYLAEDNKVREFIKKELYAAGVSKVVIERAAENQIRVSVLKEIPVWSSDAAETASTRSRQSSKS